MFAAPEFPNKLCIKDGVLLMQDGSNVQEYLRSRELMVNSAEVVILTRELAQKLAEESAAYRLSKLTDDERFCIAA